MKFQRIAGGIALAALAASAVAAQAEKVVILAGHVIAGPDGERSGPATITVVDDKIESIVPGNQPVDGADKIVDLSSKTVLPGLIDLHVHLGSDPSGDWWREAIETDEWITLTNAKNARLTAKAGFTTVRDVGNDPRASAAQVRAEAMGWFPGPRIIWAGMPLSTIGGHGDVHGFRPEVMAALEGQNTCTGADECAALTRKTVREGAAVVKFMATGGVLSQGDKSLGQAFTDSEMTSIIETSHALGVPVAAHAHADAGIHAATMAGVDTIEHGTFLSEATAKEMKAHGTVLVPTLLAFKGIGEQLGKGFYTPAVEDKIRQTLGVFGQGCRRARAAGVTVAFGTDSGVTAHGRNAEEFELLVDKCGMSPREALASATTVAAKVLGMDQQIGRLAPGYSADIIAVEGNPLEDATALQHVDWVMAQGKIVD